MKILKKVVQYYKSKPINKKHIFLYSKEGRRQIDKFFSDGKLKHIVKYFYNDANEVSEIQITYHPFSKNEFIYHIYDDAGKLKESKICSDTPDNLLYRVEYSFKNENDDTADAKYFDFQGKLLKEENSISPMKNILIHEIYTLSNITKIEDYKLMEKKEPDNYKIYSLKYFKNRKTIRFKQFKEDIVKIVADKENNIKKHSLKGKNFSFLIKKLYW